MDALPDMNILERYADTFHGIKPWKGYVPKRFIADFLGQLIDIEFHPMLFTDPSFDADTVGGGWQETALPDLGKAVTPADAEAWFEAVDWVIAAREARDRYTIISLGANYGAQAVAAQRALQAVNPLSYTLVAVEPVPDNCKWIRRHMRNNGIDPSKQWLVPLAINDRTAPLFFPSAAPASAPIIATRPMRRPRARTMPMTSLNPARRSRRCATCCFTTPRVSSRISFQVAITWEK